MSARPTPSADELVAAIRNGSLVGLHLGAPLAWPDLAFSGSIEECEFAALDLSGREFAGTTFRACTFYGCQLRRTVLSAASFERCQFFDPDTEASANLQFADLTEARFAGSDLSMANLSRCHARGIEMTDCQGQGTDFSDADFSLSAVDLASATFQRCNLAYADFSGTNLSGCELSECRLVHSVWHDADLSNADLRGSSFENIEGRGLVLNGIDLRGATINNLDPRDLDLNAVRMDLDQGIVILRTLGIELE